MEKYLRNNKEIYLPYVVDKFGDDIIDLLIEKKNWIFKDNLLIFDYDKPRPNWLEVCNTKYRRGKTIPRDKEELYSQNNDSEDQHISVYVHDDTWRKHFKQHGNVKCQRGNISVNHIYLELDRDSLEEAMIDSIKIYNAFPYREFMKFWYSGNRSIHIEVDFRLFAWDIVVDIKNAGFGKLFYNLAHKIASDVRHNNGINDPYFLNKNELKEVYEFTFGKPFPSDLLLARKELEVIDPNMYNRNSLIRQRYSYHEKGGNQKVEYTIPFMAEKVGMEYKPKRDIEVKPYLVSWLFDCFPSKKKNIVNYSVNFKTSDIVKIYSESLKYFDPNEASEDGWVNGLYSPFYPDTNPSVSVNILTGWYKDFGMPDHSFDFYTFYNMINEITSKQN